MYAFKTYRKIDVAINGVYAYSTSAYRTCKEAIAVLREKQTVIVAGIPDYTVGGNDEEDCMQRLIDLQEKHGDLTWYSGYVDQDYAAGEYVGRENFID